MLVEGKQKLDFGKKRIEFGAYAMVYLGTKGNMKKRIVPAIALKSSHMRKEDIFHVIIHRKTAPQLYLGRDTNRSRHN